MSTTTDVLSLFKYDPIADADSTFNITQGLNNNWDRLDSALLLAIAAAGAYNPEERYAVGDYCTYQGKLHRCSTAITAGETWNEAHWTATTVAAEIQELSSQLSILNTLVGGATTPQSALANLGAGVRPNLLDNGDFRAGHVVNQRGQTEYAETGYTIDRWKILNSEGKITVNNGYLTLTGTGSYGYINQPMEEGNVPSYPVTLSILTKDGELHSMTFFSDVDGFYIGTFYFYLDNGFFSIRIPDDTTSIDIVAFKYEEGSTQTLAYQDEDGAWQLLPQPESDYATQLLKCQRYYQIYSTADARPSKAVDCRPVMRTDPAQGTIVVGDTTYYFNAADT